MCDPRLRSGRSPGRSFRSSTRSWRPRRMPAHLRNRIPTQSKIPRRLALALPFDEDKPSNRCVNLHRKHPWQSLFESDFEKVWPRRWPGFTSPRATALCRRSVAYYCSAAYRRSMRRADTIMGMSPGACTVRRLARHDRCWFHSPREITES
jgi:hypothetical protein